MTLINYTARVPKVRTFDSTGAFDAKALTEEYAREYNDQIVRYLDVEPDDDRVIATTEDVRDALSGYASQTKYNSAASRDLGDKLWGAIASLAYANVGEFDNHSVQGLYDKLSTVLNRAISEAEEAAETLIKSAVSGSGLEVSKSTLDFNIAGELDAVDLVDTLKKLDNTCPGLLEELQVDFHIIDSDFKFDDPAWIRSRPSL